MAQSSHPGRVGGEQAARGRGDGSGGNRGQGGQGGRGGGSFGGGLSGHPGRIGGERAARASNEARANDRPTPGGRGGQTLVGNDTTANYQAAKNAGVSPDQYNREVTDYAGRVRDSLDSDNSTLDNLGNMIAGFLGFNQKPVEDIGFDPQNPTGPRSDWGWDPVGAIVGLGSSLAGVPFGPGLIADQLSALAGRPLEINLGPDVFGGSSVDPITGETSQTATHTGGSMTINDANDRNTFVGAPAGLALLGQGASQAMPSRSTFTGVDPAPVDPPADGGFTPTTPQPGEYEQPEGLTVDPGNTGLTGDQLTGLFSNFLNPTRTSKGRNAMRVVA